MRGRRGVYSAGSWTWIFAPEPSISAVGSIGFFLRPSGRFGYKVNAGRTSGILSIRGPEVSLGSLRVGTIHVQTPTPRAPPLQAFLVDFSQQVDQLDHE